MVKVGPRFPLRRRSSPQAPSSPPPKLALLIGIDYVNSTREDEYPPLRRARKDTKEFRNLLISKYDYRPENIVMMLDGGEVEERLVPTRDNILREIRNLVKGAREGSRFVFFYSGHSGQVESPDSDEEDGFDEFLVPVDHSQLLGYGSSLRADMKKCMILDDKLRKLLVDPLPMGAYLTAIFDSCHSGTMLDLDHYLCNNIYYPWTNLNFRRYMTKWQGVRRKDGQRMSQSGVKVITRKHNNPDNKENVGSTSSHRSREGSGCSVRIYQRKRVSGNEIQVFDTSVGVKDSEDGKKRKFSVQSRRTSVQRTPTIALVMEGAQSMNSVTEDAGVTEDEEFGPRCSSPTSLRSCSGFCDMGDNTPGSATVISISSCQDSQRIWESNKGSFTKRLIDILKLEPHQPIGNFLQTLTHKMYEHAQRTHKWSFKQKESYRLSHPEETGSNLSGSSPGGSTAVCDSPSRTTAERVEEPHYLDTLDYDTVPEPQLGSQNRVDLSQPIDL